MDDNSNSGWKLSIRDGDHYFSEERAKKNWEKYHNSSEKDLETLKQEISRRHRRLGLPDSLKYELYPELFR